LNEEEEDDDDDDDYDDDDDDDYRIGRWGKTPGKKKKSSFLGEIFDF